MSTVDVIETVKIKGTDNIEHELSTTTTAQTYQYCKYFIMIVLS